MKKTMLVVAVIAIGIAIGTTVYAANSTTNAVTVSATIQGICYFNSSASTITMGNIDPSSVSAASNSTTLQYACTKNSTPPTLTQNIGTSGCAGATGGALGQPLYLSDGTHCMKYTLSAPVLTPGAGFSTLLSEVVTATIAVVDFQNQPANNYNDTVTLTVNY